jgi:serine/threonine protein kinase
MERGKLLISAFRSDRAQTTLNVRGTSGYRAPELLTAKATFTNKTDTWAIGYILYRLVFGKQIFDDDWTAREWMVSARPLPWTNMDASYWVESGHWAFLKTVICAMLASDSINVPPQVVFSPFATLLLYTSSRYQLPIEEYLMPLLLEGFPNLTKS